MSGVDPWFSIEVIIVVLSFHENSVVEVSHSFGNKRIPLFSNSVTIATQNYSIFCHKFGFNSLIPKSISFILQIFKGRLKNTLFSFCNNFMSFLFVIVVFLILYNFLQKYFFKLKTAIFHNCLYFKYRLFF